jgi:hypothetical protein
MLHIFQWTCAWFIMSLSLLLLAIVIGRKTGGMDLGELLITVLCCILWPIGIVLILINWVSEHGSHKIILSHEDIKRRKAEGFDK